MRRRISADNNPFSTPTKIPHAPSIGRYRKNFSLPSKSVAAIICPTLWKKPPAALTPATENFSVRLSKIIAATLNSPPLMLKKIVVGEPANIPAKKIRADKIISASTSAKMYSATTVTALASPNFAPGGISGIGNKLSTANKISDNEINIASVVSRKSTTRNFNQQFVRHASNRFADCVNRAASHANFIGTISRDDRNRSVPNRDKIFPAASLKRESIFLRQVKFAHDTPVNFHDGDFFIGVGHQRENHQHRD